MNSLDLITAHYIISPIFLLLLIGGMVGILTFLFLLRSRKTPGVRYWLIWEIAATVWAFTYAFEFAATDIETKIIWSKFSYLGIVYCSVSFFFFSLEFSSQYLLLKKKLVIALFVLATIFILSPFTNELHHLHWKSYSINAETNTVSYIYGPFFWIIFAFSYLTLISGIINVIFLYFRSSVFYRRQITLLFVASLLPPIGNLMYVFHINPVPGFDWTPLTFLVTGILIAINISQFNMFDLVPFARNKLLDIMPDAILILDKSMRVADYNPAFKKLTDAYQEELVGQHIKSIFPKREELIEQIIQHNEFQSNILHELDGETSYFDLRSITLFDQNKQLSGWLLVLKDITARILAEEKSKDATFSLMNEIQVKEKLIDDLDAFSHTLAHDLKNLLGSIVGASNMIKSDIDDMSREFLLEMNDLITDSATKTIHITTELLTLASVRQQDIRPVVVNMGKAVSDSIQRLKDKINETKAILKVPETWPEVLGNQVWLEEVWTNYLSNAIKYGGIPPVIEFGSDIISENKVKYWIKDNGKGLSETEIAILFSKFTRLEPLRAEGHGLGLSIVKRIIEKLNGEVGIESQNIPGQGSTFYFILPLAFQTQE